MKATLFKRRLSILVPILAVLAFVALFVWRKSSAGRQGESTRCVNHMVAIAFAARMWSNDNGDHFPRDFLAMSNELTTPHILICPADRTRRRASQWLEVTPAHTSYEMVAPGVPESDTQTVYLRCQIHGHLGYVDGTVFDGVQRRRKL